MSALSFRQPAEDEPLFCKAMLEQGGECHEIDLPALASRVGKAQAWDVISKTVMQAMKEWAADEAGAGTERRYSVWVTQKRGMNKANNDVPLAFVYVVQHPEGDGPDPDEVTVEEAERLNPFDEAFGPWPEYVRMEYGNPLWDGATPWYLMAGNVATRINEAAPAYRVVADEVLASFWEGQYRLKEAASELVYTGDDDAQMGRGALAYLRSFVRDRRYYTQFDLPDHREDLGLVPGWIADYFDSGGMLFHTQDWKRDRETVLLALTEWPDLVLDAPSGWALEVDETGTRLVHRLAFKDPEDGDLNSQFIYNLGDRGDLEELASLAVQDEFRLHVFITDDEDGYAWFGTRTIAPDEETRMAFARMIAPVVLECAPDAKFTQLRADDDDERAEPAPEDAAMPTEHLALLDTKEMRVSAVKLLCHMGDPRYAPQICTAVEKMTWSEVNEVWESLPLLGEEAVEEFVRLTDKPKKKATAACGMRALGRIPCERSLEALASLVQELTSKAEPTEALVDLGQYAAPTLLNLSHDAKGEVRQMAAYALGKIGAVQTRDRVAEMAESDRSGKVREVAEQALAWLDGDEECEMDLREFVGGLEVP